MRIIADLHMHGKYSRAVSKNMSIPILESYARMKGITLLGTGDAQHPKWYAHLKEHLWKEKDGIYYTRSDFPFILSSEISLIYTKDRGRKVHVILLFPSFKVLDKVTAYLLSKGRIDYDGRPIFKIPCDQLVHDLKEIDNLIEIIPAHIWTPWFSLFGDKSGFDSVEECFGKEARHIHALETGMSSDPEMNWRLSMLDKYTLVSFSDAHSYHPWRMGREATIFETQLTYPSIITALHTRAGYAGTIEVDPNYGKYHYDGHRVCNVSLSPNESIKLKEICPVCKKKLTIGVLHRVEELADRPVGFVLPGHVPFYKLLPLHELLSVGLGKGLATHAVNKYYEQLKSLGTELDVLLYAPEEKLKGILPVSILRLLLLNRQGKLEVSPGYDGTYGKIVNC